MNASDMLNTVTMDTKYAMPNTNCTSIYTSINQVALSVNRAFRRSNHFMSAWEKSGRRGMRMPNRASTRRPSSNASPRTESKNKSANGKPKMKIKNGMEIETPVTAQVK